MASIVNGNPWLTTFTDYVPIAFPEGELRLGDEEGDPELCIRCKVLSFMEHQGLQRLARLPYHK